MMKGMVGFITGVLICSSVPFIESANASDSYVPRPQVVQRPRQRPLPRPHLPRRRQQPRVVGRCGDNGVTVELRSSSGGGREQVEHKKELLIRNVYERMAATGCMTNSASSSGRSQNPITMIQNDGRLFGAANAERGFVAANLAFRNCSPKKEGVACPVGCEYMNEILVDEPLEPVGHVKARVAGGYCKEMQNSSRSAARSAEEGRSSSRPGIQNGPSPGNTSSGNAAIAE